MSSNSNRNSLSLFYEKSLKKFSGVYIQTKQNSIKLLNTLNINIANKLNDNNNNVEVKQIKQISNNNLENYNKENKYVDDSRPVYFSPLTPYKVESYHSFISDVPAPEYYNYDDDNVSSINSPNSSIGSPLYKNTSFGRFSLPLYSPSIKNLYSQKSPCSINEKDFSDQESSDDQDDYFSRKRNYSSQSSSSSVSSTNFGINELALTPMSNDDGYEIIKEGEVVNHCSQEKIKERNIKRKKSTKRSITSQKSDRSIKSNKSISKLSLKLSKSKSSSSIATTNTIGTINFEEFISSLDISEDIEGRLQWLFRFYDNDGDGFITRDEMLQIMHTLYS